MSMRKSLHPGISLEGDAETENMDHEEKTITDMLCGMISVWNLAKVLKHEGNTVKGMFCGLLRGMIPQGNIAKELSIGHQNINSQIAEKSRCGDVTDLHTSNTLTNKVVGREMKIKEDCDTATQENDKGLITRARLAMKPRVFMELKGHTVLLRKNLAITVDFQIMIQMSVTFIFP